MNLNDLQRGTAEPLIERMIQAGFPAETMTVQQVLCLAEEVGEVVQAARRALGMARTPGTHEAVRLELADVVIASASLAEAMGFDLGRAVTERAAHVAGRPVRKEADRSDVSRQDYPTTGYTTERAFECQRPSYGAAACARTEPCRDAEKPR